MGSAGWLPAKGGPGHGGGSGGACVCRRRPGGPAWVVSFTERHNWASRGATEKLGMGLVGEIQHRGLVEGQVEEDDEAPFVVCTNLGPPGPGLCETRPPSLRRGLLRSLPVPPVDVPASSGTTPDNVVIYRHRVGSEGSCSCTGPLPKGCTKGDRPADRRGRRDPSLATTLGSGSKRPGLAPQSTPPPRSV